MVTTSIQIETNTREKLARLKATPRETYDDLLNKFISLIPEGDEEGQYTDTFRIGLLNARLDIRAGRTLNHALLKQRLGIQ